MCPTPQNYKDSAGVVVASEKVSRRFSLSLNSALTDDQPGIWVGEQQAHAWAPRRIPAGRCSTRHCPLWGRARGFITQSPTGPLQASSPRYPGRRCTVLWPLSTGVHHGLRPCRTGNTEALWPTHKWPRARHTGGHSVTQSCADSTPPCIQWSL